MPIVTGTASNDFINGGVDDDQISVLGGNDIVQGNGGSDTIDGGDGDDQLRGGYSNASRPPAGQIDGADILNGGAGNDVLRGQDGDDQLFGGSGDDNLRGDLGDDLLDGGEGSDFAAYRFDDIDAVTGVTFDASVVNTAATVSLSDGQGGTDTLISIERVIVTGTTFNDTITTTMGADQITTAGGNDLVNAGAGDDVIIDYNGSSTLNGGDGDDRYDMVAGGYFGGAGAGSDTLDGGAGDDLVQLLWSNISSDVTVNLTAGSLTAFTADAALAIAGANIERVVVFSGSGNDNLTGGGANDVLSGGAGNDILNGGDGDDQLEGGAGDDTMDGGAGFDRYLLRLADQFAAGEVDASGFNVSGGVTTVSDGQGGTDTISNIEGVALSGGNFNDTLIGSAGGDTLNGGYGGDTIYGGEGDDLIIQDTLGANFPTQPGVGQITVTEMADAINGGNGFDTVSYATVKSDMQVNLGLGTVANTSTGNDTLVSIEGLITGAGADSIVGSSGGDRIESGAGDDFVQGLGGDDTILGGDGNDVLNGDSGFGTGAIGGNDVINGGAGDDVIRGGAGVDQIDGGDGHDRITFYMANATQGVVADLRDQTISNDGFGNVETMNSIEGLGGGTRFADTFYGNEGDNTIFGGSGDTIEAFGGNDLVLMDAAGALVDGGAGNDTLIFGSARLIDLNGDGVADQEERTAGVSISLATSRLDADGYGGSGDVFGFENLQGTTFGDVLTGDDNANQIDGLEGNDVLTGNGGDDTLNGGAGEDQLYGGSGNDLLDGGAGGDLMVGGAGDDVYVIDQAGGPGLTGDGVIEAAGEGTDEIRTSIDWGLGGIPDVENLTALGTANIFLGGNDSNNVLTGNSGNNYFVGEGGDDTIDGGGNAADGVNSGRDIASYQLAAGTVGNVVMVEGTGADAGKLLVQLVDGATVQTFLRITPTGQGSAIVEGVGPGAYMGADTVTNIEELHVFVRTSDGSPTPPNQFVAVSLAANQFGEFLAGSEGAETLNLADYPGAINANGNHGDDVVTGTAANNGLQGGAGNDVLYGLEGDDNLNGGEGDDLLEGGSENDYMIGGAGNDTIDGGAGANDIATFNLPAGTPGSYRVVDGTGANAGKLLVERVDGAVVETVFIVTLNGSQATVEGVGLAAHLGVDIVTNVDELHFLPDGPFDSSRFVAINLSPKQFGAFVAGSEGADTIDLANYTGAINANGNRGNDVITGTTANNNLQGGAGSDTLSGEAGNDVLNGGNGTDTLFGGSGNDTLTGAADGDTLYGGDGDDVLIGAFNTGFGPQPGDSADILRGEGGNDLIRGGDGDDLLEGGDGNDNLRGDAGSDTLDGGAGEDFASYFFTALNSGITFDARAVGASATSTIADPFGGTDTLISIERIGIGGTNFDDILYGSEHLAPATGYANQMSGNDGNDQMYGGTGNDLLDGGTGGDSLQGGGGDDTLIGGAGDDVLNGGSGDDFLVGDFGNDQIDGGAGALDRGVFYLDPAIPGAFSIETGVGANAGKLLVIRTNGALVETVAEVTSVDGYTIVKGVGSAAYLGTDTFANVERLVFSMLPPDPLQNPVLPGYAVIEIGVTDGVVADGYVAGATVFVDNNRNGLFDAGEASAVTDADGKFSLVTFGGGPVLAIGGTNTDTGLANTIVLAAPSGSTVINPLTTLVQAVANAGGLNDADAQSLVKSALGLDPSMNLLTTDLLAGAAAGDPAALDAQKAAAIIVTMLEAATDAAGGVAGAEAAALAQIAEIIEAAPDGGVDLTNSAIIEAVLEAAAPAAGDLSAAAAVLSATTTAIANATSLEDLSTQQASAMLTGNDLANELVSGARGDRLSGAGGNDVLRGNGGDDTLLGGSGDDVLVGGDGFDRLFGGEGNDRFVIEGGTSLAGSKDNLAFDVIFDFDQAKDLLDFGEANLLDVRSYGNVNAAEKSLGVELDGLAKQATTKQFVTVAFGDSDGDGIADFAVAMIGTKGLAWDQIRSGQPTFGAIAVAPPLSTSGSRTVGAESSGDAFISIPDGEIAFAVPMDDTFEILGTHKGDATFGGRDDPQWMLTLVPSADDHPGEALFGHHGPNPDLWA